jgi:acyl-CoA reductase-like NAD-dependent aldehyde dehydrogenase
MGVLRARAVTGGSRFGPKGSYFYEPTIIADVQEGNRIVDEEQFGPVIPVIKYSDVDDAMARANATECVQRRAVRCIVMHFPPRKPTACRGVPGILWG